MAMNARIDVRNVLSSVHVPTLVICNTDDRVVSVEEGRYIADRIPNAKFVELPGEHLAYFSEDASERVELEIENFVTGRSATIPVPAGRVLASVLFTDIVGSTERAVAMGDETWRSLLDEHDALVRREIATFRGKEIDRAGDGFFALFDGPGRAVRCACNIVAAADSAGLQVRAGVHTGEVERRGDGVAGVGVHIGARVAGCAAAGEVLVSRTVKDLTAGSGIRFTSRGRHQLKGIEEEWELFAAAATA